MCDLSEKIQKAIKENIDTYDELCELFSIEVVEKMKQEGILIPVEGGKRYEIR